MTTFGYQGSLAGQSSREKNSSISYALDLRTARVPNAASAHAVDRR